MKAHCPVCKTEEKVPFNSANQKDYLCGCGRPLRAGKLRTEGERRETLKRTQAPARTRGPRRRQPRRDWTDAREKVETEGVCRGCGAEEFLEAAHLVGRDRDEVDPVTLERRAEPWHVHPDRVVPLCRPPEGRSCHRSFDAHELDLIGRLTPAEEIQAVRDSHTPGTRESGIELARKRLAPLAYRTALREGGIA